MKNIIVLNVKNKVKETVIHITNLKKLKNLLVKGVDVIAHLYLPRYKRQRPKRLQEKVFPVYVSEIFEKVPELKRLVIIKYGAPHDRALPMLIEHFSDKEISLIVLGTDA